MPFMGDSSRPHKFNQPSNIQDTMPLLDILRRKKNRKSTTVIAPPPTMYTPSSTSKGGSNPFASSPPRSNPFATTPTRRPAPRNSDAPPAYTPPISATADDPYAFLTTFDTIFLIDDSGSMAGSSWRETSAALTAITPICTAHDADGIDIHFLNHPHSPRYLNITRPDDVAEIFASVRPQGGTPTAARLNGILRPYLKLVEEKGSDAVKPLNVIVITDGVASDDVETVILNAAKKLDKYDAPGWQVGIQFFQVGREPGAAAALKELDDELSEDGLRDIVDTVPWRGEEGTVLNADGILKVVLGAVHRRLDRKRDSVDRLRN